MQALPRVGAPLHFRRFDSGVLVVQSDSHSDEQARALSALDMPSALLSRFALLSDTLVFMKHGKFWAARSACSCWCHCVCQASIHTGHAVDGGSDSHTKYRAVR